MSNMDPTKESYLRHSRRVNISAVMLLYAVKDDNSLGSDRVM